jgi:hypothetical protein
MPPASTDRRARLFLVLAALWMLPMAWRIYPHFGDAIRIDGRLTTVAEYLDDACGQRVGPAAATCAAESRERAQLLLRREQGRSVLLIEGPLLVYLLIYLPLRVLADWRRSQPARDPV